MTARCTFNCQQGRTCPRDLDGQPVCRPRGGRGWWLEFDDDGIPVTWSGRAPDEASAEALARAELGRRHADFDTKGARLVACLER